MKVSFYFKLIGSGFLFQKGRYLVIAAVAAKKKMAGGACTMALVQL